MIFFEDNKSFSFNTIPFKTETDLNSGLWLILSGINDTPPHIALIYQAKYYSLSARKVDCGSSLERLLNVLKHKHIPSLFIRIETKDDVSLPLENIYKDLQPLRNTEDTCFSPIKKFFSEYYSDKFSTINYVFELLALAQSQGLITECVSLFCQDTNPNNITLPKYTMAQIKNKIRALSTPITSLK